jgi:tRNA(Ile)-lysidine synthase
VSAAEAAAPVSVAEARTLFADLAGAPALVLAISGGPDSTALLVLIARWRAALRRGPKLLAVTVDHGLRREARSEARAVQRLARKLKVAHRTVRWAGKKPATGVQEAARQARYRLLANAAREAGASHVVTAHTLDDQAETVLFRLARGSGVAGLAAMARTTAFDGLTLVRPFLGIAKARLIATLKTARVAFADDPSNRDPRFARPRLRALMPALAEEGLAPARLALLSRRIRRAEAAIESAVDSAVAQVSLAPTAQNGLIALDGREMARIPAEIRLRVIARAVARVGDEGPAELGKLEALVDALEAALADPSAEPARLRRTLAGALVTLEDDRILVERAPARSRRQERKTPLTTRDKAGFTNRR